MQSDNHVGEARCTNQAAGQVAKSGKEYNLHDDDRDMMARRILLSFRSFMFLFVFFF